MAGYDSAQNPSHLCCSAQKRNAGIHCSHQPIMRIFEQTVELDVKRSTSRPGYIGNTPSVANTETTDAGRHPLAGAAVSAPGAELALSSHSHECLVGAHLQAPDQAPTTKQQEMEMADDDDWMNDVIAIVVPTSPKV
jgi:hypothetical protein